MKKKSLLKDYLQRLIKTKKPKGAEKFDDYVRVSGDDPGTQLDSALKNAYTAYKSNIGGRGASAEGTPQNGLARSGYSEYLKSSQDAAYGRAVNDATKKSASALSKQIGAYEKYLEGYIKDSAKLKQSVGSKLLSSSVTDRNAAYNYAIDSGLSDGDAKEVSDSVYSAVLKKLRTKILEQVIYQKIDYETAAELARSYGLDEKDVEGIRNEARSIISGKGKYSESYLKELEKNADKTTVTY